MKKIVSLLLVFVLALGLVACGDKEKVETPETPEETEVVESETETEESEPEASTDEELTVVTVGVVGEDSAMWPPLIEELRKEGIDVQLVKFGDYSLPNPAVNDGEVDLNAFQHYAYLNEEVENKGYNIVAIGETYISPQNIYSNSLTSLEELEDGAKVAIPNDRTNGGRALKVLEGAGLITVDPEKGYSPEVRDITSNPKNLEIVEVDAAMIYSLLDDVAIGVINGNYALDAQLDPVEDALYVEEFGSAGGERNPYINVLVAHEDEKDNPVYLKVLEVYQSEITEEVFRTDYEGYYLPGWKHE